MDNALLLNAPLPRGEMWLDLTDEETLVLLNLLTETLSAITSASGSSAASGQVRTDGTSTTTAGPAPDGLLTTGTQGLGAQFR